MSVKKKDRHISKNDCLYHARILMNQILILTRPREFSKDGKQIQKPGILGEGQPLQVFGLDLIKCGKRIHANSYAGNNIYLHDEESLIDRSKYFKRSIEYCDSILHQIDLCIFQYAKNNKQKRKSFEYLAKLTLNTKRSLQDRLNKDNLIYEHKYQRPFAHRRGR